MKKSKKTCTNQTEQRLLLRVEKMAMESPQHFDLLLQVMMSAAVKVAEDSSVGEAAALVMMETAEALTDVQDAFRDSIGLLVILQDVQKEMAKQKAERKQKVEMN